MKSWETRISQTVRLSELAEQKNNFVTFRDLQKTKPCSIVVRRPLRPPDAVRVPHHQPAKQEQETMQKRQVQLAITISRYERATGSLISPVNGCRSPSRYPHVRSSTLSLPDIPVPSNCSREPGSDLGQAGIQAALFSAMGKRSTISVGWPGCFCWYCVAKGFGGHQVRTINFESSFITQANEKNEFQHIWTNLNI